jgi:hypothetical protein
MPGQVVVKVAASRHVFELPRAAIVTQDFALRHKPAAETSAVLAVALAEANPGVAFQPQGPSATIAGGAELALLRSSEALRPYGAIGILPAAPSTLEVPLNVGVHLGGQRWTAGLHVLGLWYRDAYASAEGASLAQTGLVLTPKLTVASGPGRVRLLAELAFDAERSQAVGVEPSADSLTRRRDYLSAALAGIWQVSDSLELAARVSADHAPSAPALAAPTFIERLHAFVDLGWRLSRAQLVLRYAFDSDRESFDPVPRRAQRHLHRGSVAVQADLLSARPGLLRLTSAFGAELDQEAAVTLARYYALLRADVRLTPRSSASVDYRLLWLAPNAVSGGAGLHTLGLELAHALNDFVRVGVVGAVQQRPAEREFQLFGRLQVHR